MRLEEAEREGRRREGRATFPFRLAFLFSLLLASFACRLLPPLPFCPPLFQTLLPLPPLLLFLGSPLSFSPRARARGKCSGAPAKSDAAGPVPRSESHEAAVNPATDQGGGGLLTTREPTLSRLHAAFLLVGRAGRRRADIFVVVERNKKLTFETHLRKKKKKKKKKVERKRQKGEKK